MILVIGGTGKTGREVVRLLAARGQAVRAMVRDPFAASALAGPRVELVQGDLARPESLAAALEGVDRAFLVSTPSPEMVGHQRAAIAAARAAGLRRLVRVSALGAGTDLPVRITTWHTELEQAVDESGIPAVQLRPTSFMQNFLGSADVIRAAGQVFGASQDGTVAYIDARDVAAAGVGALLREDHADEKPALTGPASLSLDEVAATFAAELGRPVVQVDIPPEALKAGMQGAGLPEWLAEDLTTLAVAGRGQQMPVTDWVERLAGQPPRDLATFIRDHRAAFA